MFCLNFTEFPKLSRKPDRKFNIRGTIVISEVMVASLCPLSFTIMGIYEDVDPTYFLLRDMLPETYYWNIKTIILCILFRLYILFIGALEVARTLSLATAFFIAGLEVYRNILETLEKLDRKNFLIYYRQFRLAHCSLKYFMDEFMACGLSASFVILVCLLWFTVRSYGRIHWLLYGGFVMCVSFLIAATLLIFPRVVDLYEKTRVMVKKWKLMSSTRWDFKRIGKRDGMAQAPLHFSFYFFFAFKLSSLRTFFSTVMESWFTSVILVHF